MATINSFNVNSLLAVGGKAAIILYLYGTATVDFVTVEAILKNCVKVKDSSGNERTFMLSGGYERGTSKEWNKPYLYDYEDGQRVAREYEKENAQRARRKRRMDSLDLMRGALAAKDDEAFKAALAKLNEEEQGN